MRIIARSTLLRFARTREGRKDHKALSDALDVWYHLATRAHWRTTSDVRVTFAGASIINSERLVFNIKGNDYRLITSIDFEKSIIWIEWIGSHRDYDRIDAAKVKYG